MVASCPHGWPGPSAGRSPQASGVNPGPARPAHQRLWAAARRLISSRRRPRLAGTETDGVLPPRSEVRCEPCVAGARGAAGPASVAVHVCRQAAPTAGCACSPCSWNAPAGSPSPFPGGQGSRGRRCLPVPSLNREADTHGQTGRLPRSPRPARSPPAPTTLAERGALHLCRLPLCHRGLGRLAAEAPSAE